MATFPAKPIARIEYSKCPNRQWSSRSHQGDPSGPALVAPEVARQNVELGDDLRRRTSTATLARLTVSGTSPSSAFGAAGEFALVASAEIGGIQACALIGAPLTSDAVAVVAAWPELPVLAAADPADHAGLRGAVDAYLASAS